MASNVDGNSLVTGKDEANCSETTVEIKIKTLDSQTYTLRVDKCVPVPALKEQIAVVTGVLSEQQRLICRGKVLKDDQLLSAYHVEDGHTLHLVVRQPVDPSSEGFPNTATDPASTSGRSQGSRGAGVFFRSYNISEQDAGFPDFSRIFSSLADSLGRAGVGSGGEGIDLNENPLESIFNSSRPEADQADSGSFSVPNADSEPPVLPDSLPTLSQNLNRLRQEFIANVQELNNFSQAVGNLGRDGQNSDAASTFSVHRGLPTPASLADVMLTARQILNEQVEECLLLLSRELEGHANVTDASERARIQSSALRSGILLQHLGAVMLELARSTMTLRMGQTPAEAIVNSGPAVFLSPNGPNPIMVQPLPSHLGTGLGAAGRTAQQSSGPPTGSGGAGVFPRNIIDIRVRTVAMPANANRRESNAQNGGSAVPGASNNGSSAQPGSGSPGTRESEVRVVPIRTVVTGVPASGGRAASDAPTRRGTMGMILPIFARVQRVTSGGSGGGIGVQASDPPQTTRPDDQGSQSIPNSAVGQESIRVVGVDGDGNAVGEATDGSGFASQFVSRLEQFLGGLFSGEHLQEDDGGNPQAADADASTGAAENGNQSDAAAGGGGSEEGAFLSNLLRQIMPIISENTGGAGADNLTSGGGQGVDVGNRQGSATQAGEGNENGESSSSSSRQQEEEPGEQPDAKRQKRD